MTKLWVPCTPFSTPEGRILSRSLVEAFDPCILGWRRFLKVSGGGDALVNQEWARRMADAGAPPEDATWAGWRFLPKDWRPYYDAARGDYYGHPRRAHIQWAVFAALYVEAGKP
jgi:hypothetical protein